MMTGKPLKDYEYVDHINGVRHDNRWCNLRIVSSRMNNQNRALLRAGDKLIGTSKDRGGYTSEILHNGSRIYLGHFKTEIQAHTAYMDYMDEHNITYLKEIDKRREK